MHALHVKRWHMRPNPHLKCIRICREPPNEVHTDNGYNRGVNRIKSDLFPTQ